MERLPVSPESEQNVLCSILMGHDEALSMVCDFLKPAHFYDERHRKTYAAMLALFDKGEPIDYVSVSAEIARSTDKPFLVDMSALLDSTPTPYHIIHHAKEVVKLAGCRAAIALAGKMAAIFHAIPDNLDSAIGQITSELLGIADRTKRSSPDPKEIIMEINNRDRSHVTYSTIGSLNRLANGFEPTHLWVIGGFSSTGKTAFALQLLLDLLDQGRRCIYFSLEMSRLQLMLRLLGNRSGVRIWNIDRGEMGPDDRLDVLEAEDWFGTQCADRLWLYDDVYELPEMGYLSRRQQIKTGVDVVFIDFLQNLQGGGDEYERLSGAAKTIQQLAKQLNCTFVVLSQISNEQARDSMGTSQAYSFKGSGAIRDAADKAIMLTRDRTADMGHEVGLMTMNLMKNRQGPIGEAKLRFEFGTGRITGDA